MIKSSTVFVTPLTLQSLPRNPVYTDATMETDPNKTNHIELAKKTNLFLVVPISANTIGKLARGIVDDLSLIAVLTLHPGTPKVITPTTNMYMYRNPIIQRGIGILKEIDYQEIIPRETLSACGDCNHDTLATVKDILQTVVKILASGNKK